METILSGLSDYLHVQMSMQGKLANVERFILSYFVYFFIIQSLHVPFLMLFFLLIYFFTIWGGSKSFETKKGPSCMVRKKGLCLR